jgi:hypothetical protein
MIRGRKTHRRRNNVDNMVEGSNNMSPSDISDEAGLAEKKIISLKNRANSYIVSRWSRDISVTGQTSHQDLRSFIHRVFAMRRINNQCIMKHRVTVFAILQVLFKNN